MSMALLVNAVLLAFLSVGSAQTFVSVDCKAEKVGQYGTSTMLECLVHSAVKGADITFVTWRKEGGDKAVLAYDEHTAADTVKEPGYQFADKSWTSSNTNVSLLITNTAISHAGKYICTVMTDSGDATGSVNLRVTAKYDKPTVQRTVSSGENAVECHSNGGYPQGQLRWIVNGDLWKETIETDVKESESGLYNLSSRLTLTKDSPFTRFTCVVFNASGEKEHDGTLEIPEMKGRGADEQRSPAVIVAPLLIIGSLIVGLLLLLFLKRRSRHDRPVCRCELDAEQGADQETVDKCENKPCLRE